MEFCSHIYVRALCQIVSVLLFSSAAIAAALDAPWPQPAITRESTPRPYYWKPDAVGNDAQLLTLFCGSCGAVSETHGDVPLLAVLRDTLGDENDGNDRVTYIWLLSYSRPTIGRRLLSAVPFFYWHVGRQSSHVEKGDIKPFFNVQAPRHPVLTRLGQDIVQYTTLDSMMTPIRATSRAYRTNELDHERLNLEQAISYLRRAPTSNSMSELSTTELNTVLARLELRKKLLGGLVSDGHATRFGEESGLKQERNRSRNWELLRSSADRTGLVFEPVALGGTTDQYASLWLPTEPAGGQKARSSTDLSATWKLLGIKNPWQDSDWTGQGRTPLAFYSLNYPNKPLLLIDFRDKSRTRRHELIQRTINEVTAGIIGLSHFTNWYYFVAADVYDFVASRHGRAMDQAERLDCYSQFRVALALDRQLDPQLRKELQQRINALSLNPLETSTARDLNYSRQRYSLLEAEAQRPDGWLAKRLDNERRAELASIGTNRQSKVFADVLHVASLGLYTRRSPQADDNLPRLDSYRRVEHDLNFLEGLVNVGTPPEIVYQPARIQAAVTELRRLLPQVSSVPARTRAVNTLSSLRNLSEDADLRADCSWALAAIDQPFAGPHVATATAGAEIASEDLP